MKLRLPTFTVLGLLLAAAQAQAQAQPASERASAPDEPVPAAPRPAAEPERTGAPAVPVASPAQPDLAAALAGLFDAWATPEARVRALDNPALTDPRAIPSLAFLLRDAEPRVAAAAARALGRFPDDRQVRRALLELFGRQNRLDEVRIGAAEALGRLRAGADVADALQAVSVDEEETQVLRQAARAALHTAYPEAFANRREEAVVDRSGRGLLTLGGTVLGSYALGAVGTLGRNDAGATIGFVGGALMGGATSYLLTRAGEITRPQAAWMVSAGVWGAGLGMLGAHALADAPSSRLVLGLGLLGEGLAFGAAAGTRHTMPFEGADITTINLSGVVGIDLAYGGLLLGNGGSPRAGSAVLLGAGAAGLAAGLALTRDLHFTTGDVALTVDGGYEGVVVGALAAQALDPSPTDRHAGAGAYLGLGLGLVGGAVLAQHTDYSEADVTFVFVTGSYGKLLGLAMPLLTLDDPSDRAVARGAIAGSLVSLTAAHLLAPKARFSGGDSAMVALATGLGLWHGVVLAATSDLSAAHATGVSLLGVSAAGLGAMGAAQLHEPTVMEVLAVGGGAFWGTWFSAWGADLGNLETKPALRLTLAAGDVGLVGAGLLVSPLLSLDPRRIGIANVGGLAGAGIGSLVVALASNNNRSVIAGNLAGSALGLIGGAILAANLDLPAPSGPAQKSQSGRTLASGFGPPLVAPLVIPRDARSGAAAPTVLGLGVTFVEIP